MQTKRLHAAKLIQKSFRGYQTRVLMVQTLLQFREEVSSSSSSSSAKSADVKFGIVQRLGGVLQKGLVDIIDRQAGKKREILISFLQEYNSCSQNQNDATQIQHMRGERYVLYHRILVACLAELNAQASTFNSKSEPSKYVEVQPLMDFIKGVFTSCSPAVLQQIVRHCAFTTFGGKQWDLSPVEWHLLQCLQTFLWSSTSTSSDSSDSDGNRDNDKEVAKQYTLEFMCMALGQISHLKNSNNGQFQARFAAIVLGIDMEQSRAYYVQLKAMNVITISPPIESNNTNGNGGEIETDLDWYIFLWKTLYDDMVIREHEAVENGTTSTSVSGGIGTIVAGREVTYLKNVLDILSLSKSKHGSKQHNHVFVLELLLVKFMGFLFDPFRIGQSASGKGVAMELQALMILSGLAAKGMDPISLYQGKAKTEFIDLTEDSDDDENENDEDGDAEMEDSPSFRSVSASGMPVTTSRTNQNQQNARKKMCRQDLQTMHKLDHLYKVKLSRAQNETVEWLRKQPFTQASNLCKIAKDLGGGEIIARLIPSVFQPNTSAEVQNTFSMILSMVMQNCTGVVARDCAMSPLLSKLAFHPTFLETLWVGAKRQLSSVAFVNGLGGKTAEDLVKAYSAIGCFCDLFSHQLMALDDEEFLISFTNKNPNGKSRSQILAADVVDTMRTLLYEMYWSKPVVSSDFDFPFNHDSVVTFQRARLLLSGTKVWNSLYIRWSRQFRTAMFCNEETWWFPHLVTRHQDESGAMDPRPPSSLNQAMQEADNESVDSAMEIDENAQSGENEDLASSFKDPKVARILASIPQALPFDRRAKLFSSLLAADIIKTQDESAAMRDMMWNMQRGIEGAEFTGRERVTIRRDELYHDSKDQLSALGRKLKKKVQVTFISKHGSEEAGVDGGGLFKEFLDDLIKEAFDPEAMREGARGPLFIESPLRTLAVNTSLKPTQATLAHYQFLGRVLGKAVYESILVDPQFCLPFLNQLLGQHNTIDDLKNLDPTYYKHLSSLRTMSEKEIKSLELTFELTVATEDRSSRTIELLPGGSSIPVSKENAIRYVHLVAHRRLNMETAIQTNAFLHGFRDLIPASWVRLFSPYELQKVISGDDAIQGFDVKSLKNVMLYGGGYHPSQVVIQWFWEVIDEMTPEQKSKFLKFVTSCSRQPLLGFGALVPLPCITQVRLPESEHDVDERQLRLPTSATCMHLLKLPNYKSKQILRSKVLYAVESGAGFELS